MKPPFKGLVMNLGEQLFLYSCGIVGWTQQCIQCTVNRLSTVHETWFSLTLCTYIISILFWSILQFSIITAISHLFKPPVQAYKQTVQETSRMIKQQSLQSSITSFPPHSLVQVFINIINNLFLNFTDCFRISHYNRHLSFLDFYQGI